MKAKFFSLEGIKEFIVGEWVKSKKTEKVNKVQ